MDNQEINSGRRRFLTLATCGAGGVAALGVATPFVASFFPSVQGFDGVLKIGLAGPWTLAATVERPCLEK